MALLKDQGSIPLKYREIGRRIGEKYPQTVKHHIEALKNSQLIIEQNSILRLNSKDITNKNYLNIPFYGLANCGEATRFAEDKAEGFLRISRSVLPGKSPKNLFVLRASGNSMNMARIGLQKQGIENGDFVIVDSQERHPVDGDYIVSIIDSCANIKKYRYLLEPQQVHLLSESSDAYLPIVLHISDNFHVVGKIIGVIKNFDNP
ncbi:MAG: S24 family peptidase [bacterium]